MSGFLSSMVGATYAPAITFANATGGTITTYTADGKTYRVHKFTSVGSNNLVVTAPGLIDFLLVGGGGGVTWSGDNNASTNGGGGGSAVEQLLFSATAQTYSLVVGARGVRRDPFASPVTFASAGSASTGFGFTASGGAAGTTLDYNKLMAGGAGAGGAGQAGGAAGGDGGIGYLSDMTGTATRYGGGGGGGAARDHAPGGSGGAGGGGTGRYGSGSLYDSGAEGQNEFGGGGGGYAQYSGSTRMGGNGGSGVVIVRYQIA